MQVTKVLGLAAVGALLVLAAPGERAQALSLSNPGAGRRCSRTSSRTRPKCGGDIIMAGTTAGIVTIAGTIIVTGAAGNFS